MGVIKFPNPPLTVAAEVPQKALRHCDYSLIVTVRALESQLGTIEAYNRLIEAAVKLRVAIDNGRSCPPLVCFDPV
ncbi:MAG: hypothetical protein NVS1B11_36690 [Terriglobales bacterium]